MNAILALDPGTTETGWCLFANRRFLDCGIEENSKLAAVQVQGDQHEQGARVD